MNDLTAKSMKYLVAGTWSQMIELNLSGCSFM